MNTIIFHHRQTRWLQYMLYGFLAYASVRFCMSLWDVVLCILQDVNSFKESVAPQEILVVMGINLRNVLYAIGVELKVATLFSILYTCLYQLSIVVILGIALQIIRNTKQAETPFTKINLKMLWVMSVLYIVFPLSNILLNQVIIICNFTMEFVMMNLSYFFGNLAIQTLTAIFLFIILYAFTQGIQLQQEQDQTL